ncbi:mechanosensitive ion channel family protein [Sulfolobus sp. S-194]|uniref:mechanosensitive ion channel family protein n=1 Tax=Sulfolobus sp. S-194 TaxID=2512240 RepID=UPI0014372849|nr:mechanosensitive ion channel family protein [Sulfolobus sp. S-194]QIW24489.1 mechanosensitive ion channel family protein [Sulfolobus sp. S-194]
MLKFYQKFLLGILLAFLLFVINAFVQTLKPSSFTLLALRAFSIVAGGIYFTIIFSDGVREVLERRKTGTLPAGAIIIPSIIKYIGYILVFIGVLATFGVTSAEALAGGTFAGLVFGLALQPVLENFFAGILIISTGFISIGDHIRVLNSQIPYMAANLPPYKYFSREYFEQGLEGTVVEIDLFYSRLILENGREYRIPNSILLKSSVIDYTSKFSKKLYVSIRVEFPLDKINLNTIEEEVKEALKGFEIEEGPYLSEQSDKEHIIILLRIATDVDNWKKTKSEALKRILALRYKIVKGQTV